MVIDLERRSGQKATVEFENFVVGDESSKYTLESVGEIIDTQKVGNSFNGADFGEQGFGGEEDRIDTKHIGMQFSTYDSDNDGYDYGNCATEDSSGWWFNRCSAV